MSECWDVFRERRIFSDDGVCRRNRENNLLGWQLAGLSFEDKIIFNQSKKSMNKIMTFMCSSYIIVRHKEEETQMNKDTVVNKGGWTEKV